MDMLIDETSVYSGPSSIAMWNHLPSEPAAGIGCEITITCPQVTDPADFSWSTRALVSAVEDNQWSKIDNGGTEGDGTYLVYKSDSNSSVASTQEGDIYDTSFAESDNSVDREIHATQSHDFDLAWNSGYDNDVLYGYSRDAWNIVLDSIFPEVAPHIVITPTQETWDSYTMPWHNRVGLQWTGNLMVPAVNVFDAYLPPLGCSSSAHCSPLPEKKDTEFSHPQGATRVFSGSVFNKFIDSTLTERLAVRDVVRVVQRQRCKAAFFDASSLALLWRERYDGSANLFCSLEKAFEWSDPAVPILSNAKWFGTTIIDSTCPFLAPHIIIDSPAPQDLSIPWLNATNDPQDCGYGQYLVVPSPGVKMINDGAQDWENTSPGPSVSDVTVDLLESSSSPGTPYSENRMDDDKFHFFADTNAHDVYLIMTDSGTDDLRLDTVLHFLDNHLWAVESKPPQRPIFTIEEDDEDLPPLDDWYQ